MGMENPMSLPVLRRDADSRAEAIRVALTRAEENEDPLEGLTAVRVRDGEVGGGFMLSLDFE